MTLQDGTAWVSVFSIGFKDTFQESAKQRIHEVLPRKPKEYGRGGGTEKCYD